MTGDGGGRLPDPSPRRDTQIPSSGLTPHDSSDPEQSRVLQPDEPDGTDRKRPVNGRRGTWSTMGTLGPEEQKSDLFLCLSHSRSGTRYPNQVPTDGGKTTHQRRRTQGRRWGSGETVHNPDVPR